MLKTYYKLSEISFQPKPTTYNFADIEGQKFNRLLVIGFVGRNKRSNALWLCKCECGNIIKAASGNLKSGHTTSCGCVLSDFTIKKNYKHGKTGTPTYKIWCEMRKRCSLKQKSKFPHYSGRGIKICDRWFESYENFLADMGERPSPKHSIERINNNGNYEPSNCQWATQIEQNNNTRQNLILTYKGRTQTATQWGRELNLNAKNVIRSRKYKGWCDRCTLSIPVGQKRIHKCSSIK